MANEYPILFSAPMVRAILAGAKTQTRRVMKHQPIDIRLGEWTLIDKYGRKESPVREFRFEPRVDGLLEFARPDVAARSTKAQRARASEFLNRCHKGDVRWTDGEVVGLCPYGQRGDRLIVRETWRVFSCYDHIKPRDLLQHHPGYVVHYDADSLDPRSPSDPYQWGKVRQSIFMPRWASRITLEVTDVRVQRLQDISEEDAKAEGVTDSFPEIECNSSRPYQEGFRRLWDSINAKRCPWESNPFVWAVSFRRISL